jgi:hypothetical protein
MGVEWPEHESGHWPSSDVELRLIGGIILYSYMTDTFLLHKFCSTNMKCSSMSRWLSAVIFSLMHTMEGWPLLWSYFMYSLPPQKREYHQSMLKWLSALRPCAFFIICSVSGALLLVYIQNLISGLCPSIISVLLHKKLISKTCYSLTTANHRLIKFGTC